MKMRINTLPLIASAIGLAMFLAYVAFLTFLPPPAFSVANVRLNFYDYSTREPIYGLTVNLTIATKTGDISIISGKSCENGSLEQTVPMNSSMLPISAENIDISGCWVLERVKGEKAWSVADGLWVAANPSAFSSDFSQYMFDGQVHLSQEREASVPSLRLDFYLAPGKIIALNDPLREARYYDRHLSIKVLNCNFVRFAADNFSVVPVKSPLIADLEVDYSVYYTQPSIWEVHISVEVGNRTFINLMPSFFGAISSAQINALTRTLAKLRSSGFELTEHYREIDRIASLYDLAIEGLENGDYETFSIYAQTAMNSYRDLYADTTRIYTNALGCIPSLIMIFVFFSLSLSRLITDKKDHSAVLFVVLFLAVFWLFVFTQPYLRLFIFDPLALIQSFTLSVLIQLMVQLLPLVVLTTLVFFGQIKDFIRETFEIGIRNLRRRRLKTLLALFSVLIVSASAMCFLTITTEKPTFQVPDTRVRPILNGGLVIYKIMSQVFPEERAVREFNVPIQQYEVEWLSQHEWVEAMNVYRIGKVEFERTDGFVIENFSTFNLVVVNASFMNLYQRVSDLLGIEWFRNSDRNSVILGSRIAEAYDLKPGSEVLINDKRYVVRSIVDEQAAGERLKDIDGDTFLFMIYDPRTGKIDGDSFILGTSDDFESDGSFPIYRVSIVLKTGYAQDAVQTARNIQGFGYDFGTTVRYSYVVTYSVHAISSNSVYIVSSQSPMTSVSGFWQAQIVLVAISTFVLVANAAGTVAERRSEVRTIYTIGASPLRVGLVFITEGLALGIVGGIFGYVFGYSLVRFANLALPMQVKENIVGGAPFIIAISTATLASLLGCLLPSRKAIRMAVPSGRLRQRTLDIIEIRGDIAYLRTPLKLETTERDLFKRFLEDLADEYSFSKYRYMVIDPPHIRETSEGTIYEIPVKYGELYPVLSFLVSILAKSEEDVEVTIQPIEDIRTKKTIRWSHEHKKNIWKLSRILREQILRFIEFKTRF